VPGEKYERKESQPLRYCNAAELSRLTQS
jgi:hypothetical protein